jgi:hypothetical protein
LRVDADTKISQTWGTPTGLLYHYSKRQIISHLLARVLTQEEDVTERLRCIVEAPLNTR